jgi:hypothetical protein
VKFVWRKFSSVGIGEWWDEMRWSTEKSSSLGMPMSPQEISKRYKRQSLGIPPRAPLLHRQKSGHLSTHYIFIASYSMCFLGTSLLLLLVLFCFVFCNKWLDPKKFLLEEIYIVFHCQEHSSFHSYRSTSVLFF